MVNLGKIAKQIIIGGVVLMGLVACGSKKVNNAEMLTKIAKKEFVLNNKFQEAEITLAFDSERYYGNAGVNNYTGLYNIDANGIIHLSDAACTKMMGPPEIMPMEDEYLKNISSVKSITIEENLITIITTNNKELKFIPIK